MRHVFDCRRCGEPAGELTLYAPAEPATRSADRDAADPTASVVDSGSDRVRLAMRSGLGDVVFYEFDLKHTLAALAAGDARALHAINREMVPFWCPTCHASYCASEWNTWDLFDEGFFDERRGRCPKGHERMLLD